MIRFNNDYNHTCHPAILAKLNEISENAYAGYGQDELCDEAKKLIQKQLGKVKADIHFFIGGTQVNYTAILSALKPYQSILCADSGHINVHETGAVENTGHKIEALKGELGKINASQIDKAANLYETSPVPEHITQPKLVYISQPTEFGTIYSKKELSDISKTCKKHNLFLFIDGARLGYALGSEENDASLNDLARLSDFFYIGGTKCGALFGEALIITNDSLKTDFRSYIKQNGALLAKGFLLGVQFLTLFENNLYFDITKKAVAQAMKIKKAFKAKGIPSYIESPTNQQFVIVTRSQKSKLSRKFIYEEEGNLEDGKSIIRFCTSWSTTDQEVDTLIAEIEKL